MGRCEEGGGGGGAAIREWMREGFLFLGCTLV